MSTSTHVNPVSGRPFKAEEGRALDAAMRARRFDQPQWATYWQWKGTGRLVRKGEDGTTCTGSSGFQWRVFNVAQTEEVGKEAARASVATRAPSPKATPRKAGATAAPESKSVKSGARGAPAVTVATLSAVALREALEWTKPAVSNEETRYYLNGVFFSTGEGKTLDLVATDGHRLHAQSLPCSWRGGKSGPAFIMPSGMVRDVIKAIGGKPRELTITINGEGEEIAVAIAGGATIKGTAIDGTFPDYQRVIPQNRRAPVTVDAPQVLRITADAIAAAKAKDKRSTAYVGVDAAGVHLTGATLSSPGAWYNAAYLRGVAKIGAVLEVAFDATTPASSPAYIATAGSTRFAVLMPVRGDGLPAPPPVKAPEPAKVDAPAEEPATVAPPPVTAEVVPFRQPTPAPVSTVGAFRQRFAQAFGRK